MTPTIRRGAFPVEGKYHYVAVAEDWKSLQPVYEWCHENWIGSEVEQDWMASLEQRAGHQFSAPNAEPDYLGELWWLELETDEEQNATVFELRWMGAQPC